MAFGATRGTGRSGWARWAVGCFLGVRMGGWIRVLGLGRGIRLFLLAGCRWKCKGYDEMIGLNWSERG